MTQNKRKILSIRKTPKEEVNPINNNKAPLVVQNRKDNGYLANDSKLTNEEREYRLNAIERADSYTNTLQAKKDEYKDESHESYTEGDQESGIYTKVDEYQKNSGYTINSSSGDKKIPTFIKKSQKRVERETNKIESTHNTIKNEAKSINVVDDSTVSHSDKGTVAERNLKKKEVNIIEENYKINSSKVLQKRTNEETNTVKSSYSQGDIKRTYTKSTTFSTSTLSITGDKGGAIPKFEDLFKRKSPPKPSIPEFKSSITNKNSNKILEEYTSMLSGTKQIEDEDKNKKNTPKNTKNKLDKYKINVNTTFDNTYNRYKPHKKTKKSHKNNTGLNITTDVAVKKDTILIPEHISIQDLARKMSEKAASIVKHLFKLGVMTNVNETIDAEVAEMLLDDLGYKFKRISNKERIDELLKEYSANDGTDTLTARPPVVTVMGHVDHGKTSLLDALKSTDVAQTESGGITQKIGAYMVTLSNGEHITFLDTPGHEAFTAMRVRGAKVTDIVILVVAANDGIKPQTIEAIDHAKAAATPIIVAINKIDLDNANVAKIKSDLCGYNLIPSEMGGDTMMIEISAKQKIGLEALEEAILLQAELLELKAKYDKSASGIVLESNIDKSKGPVASIIVQEGELKIGDNIVCGSTTGKIRSIIDDKGKRIQSAHPSYPVKISGIESAPSAGEPFFIINNEKISKELADLNAEKENNAKLSSKKNMSIDQLFAQSASEKKELSVIIKADTQGSAEAIAHSLEKLSNDNVDIKIHRSAAGAISESDITLASASNALIIGFNVRSNANMKVMSLYPNVDIRYYSVIYAIIEDVEQAISGMLAKTEKEEVLGLAEVRNVFNIKKYGKIAGCYVLNGLVKRGASIRILRDDIVIYDGTIKSLRKEKDDIKEASKGHECGISIENYEDIKVGDKLEVYEIVNINK